MNDQERSDLARQVAGLRKLDHNGPGCRAGGYWMIESSIGLYVEVSAVLAILAGTDATPEPER